MSKSRRWLDRRILLQWGKNIWRTYTCHFSAGTLWSISPPLLFAVSPSTPSTRPSWTLLRMPRPTPSTVVTAPSTSGKQPPQQQQQHLRTPLSYSSHSKRSGWRSGEEDAKLKKLLNKFLPKKKNSQLVQSSCSSVPKCKNLRLQATPNIHWSATNQKQCVLANQKWKKGATQIVE